MGNLRDCVGWLISAAVSAAFLGASAVSAGGPMPDFVPGQVWSIKSEAPTTAKIVIGRIEPWADKVAIHVSIIEVPVPQGLPGAGGTTTIGHTPFEKSALAASVDRLLATGVLPAQEFQAGYGDWQAAKGGIFTISASQAIEFIFSAIKQHR